jgi:cobalt-zinc-cadmium efflux system membrane fusion protein
VKRLLAIALLAIVAGCDRNGKEPAPQVRIEQHSVVVFPANSPQLGAITSVAVEPFKESTLRFNGRLVWNEDHTVRIYAPFGGRVMSIEVRPGDRVRAGQTLAVLAAPELGVAQAEARRAEQDNALARKNLARIEELYMAGVAPAKDLQSAQAEVARSEADRERTRAKLRLYGKADTVDQTLALKSPIDGVVVERNLNPGQEIRADGQGEKGLFVVSDPGKLWFLLDVAEKDVGRVTPGTEVTLASTSLGPDRVTGKVMHVADLVDPQTRTVKVRGSVKATDERLKAEMYVVAELRVPSSGGFLVPAHAVYLRGEQYYVFVDEGGGRFARRGIRPGPLLDGTQVVMQGLSVGEKVVVDGSLLLERLLASKG